MNRRELNVLQTILVKRKQLKKFESESKFSKIITNDEYYRIKNIDELQQMLKEIVSNKALVNTKEINKSIRLIFQKELNISYSFIKKNKHNQEFDTQLQEIIDILKRMLNNDATKKRYSRKEL